MPTATAQPALPFGAIKTCGPFGPKYQVCEPLHRLDDGDGRVRVRLVETGEGAGYCVSCTLDEPEAGESAAVAIGTAPLSSPRRSASFPRRPWSRARRVGSRGASPCTGRAPIRARFGCRAGRPTRRAARRQANAFWLDEQLAKTGIADARKHHQQYQEHLQSKHNGEKGASCASCHTPHSLGAKKPAMAKDSCASCHKNEKFDLGQLMPGVAQTAQNLVVQAHTFNPKRARTGGPVVKAGTPEPVYVGGK